MSQNMSQPHSWHNSIFADRGVRGSCCWTIPAALRSFLHSCNHQWQLMHSQTFASKIFGGMVTNVRICSCDPMAPSYRITPPWKQCTNHRREKSRGSTYNALGKLKWAPSPSPTPSCFFRLRRNEQMHSSAWHTSAWLTWSQWSKARPPLTMCVMLLKHACNAHMYMSYWYIWILT